MDTDTFVDEESLSALDGILYREDAATLTETLVSLKKHQRKMLRLRFGIYDPSNRGKGFWTRDSNDRLVKLEFTGRPLRLREVGAIYLLSAERARQMIEEAMSLVRRGMSSRALKNSVLGLSYLGSSYLDRDEWRRFCTRYMELHLGNTLYDHEDLFQAAYAGDRFCIFDGRPPIRANGRQVND